MVKDTLLETFKKNKLEISKAVTTPFPFLEMLRDHSLIPEKMYHRAQKEYQKLVPMYRGSLCTYGILMELEKKFSTKILAVLFHPASLKEYPRLVQIQKHFKDVPLDESASEASVRSPVWRSSLYERTSASSAPQSSIQVTQLRVQEKAVVSRKAKGPKINFRLPELPVTCGKAKGTLHKKKMEKGSSEKCIEMADGRWFTLREFEIKGHKISKNWKKNIYSGGYTLHYLIKKKFLLCPPRICGKTKKQGPGKTQCQVPARRQVFSLADRSKYRAQLQARKWIFVSCGLGSERLFKDRFASFYKGKCIQTARGWCTPQEFLASKPEINIATWTHSIRCGKLTLQTLIENDILKLHPDTCSCEICQDEDPFPENDNECFMCKDGGELFCCDSCPKSFHRNCHIPSVSSESSAEWNCTFCKIRKNREKERPENDPYQQQPEPLKQQMYTEQQLKCEFLLMRMYYCRESFLFTGDPRHHKGYSKEVTDPMWLDKVKEHLNNGTYNTVEDFVSDMCLIFYNCKQFNKAAGLTPLLAFLILEHPSSALLTP
ncbi:nuclear body protein SP140-like [Trichosurus vulpecula]|uniref:nuclear body protein SP140-like n=1 Tax=Trichosurus vulpecula TaxID=9337 RepID=UPI00186ACFBD|nr:nuclear body protein SP140-like [Trichosurus vulpecula]